MTAIRRAYLPTAVAAVLCFLSCSGGRTGDDDDGDADSLWATDPAIASSVAEARTQVGEPEEPATELLSFNDFFYIFARNKSYQAAHIKFPIDILELDGESRTMSSGAAFRAYFNWPVDEEYTLLVTDLEELEALQSDMGLDSVAAEVIDLEAMTLRSYAFLNRDSVWLLHHISNFEPQGREGDFLRFYSQFAADTLFQERSLADYIHFTSPDPDDETGIIEGTLLASQWQAFRPDLPQGVITNIFFGQPLEEARRVLLLQCATASSMLRTYTFEQKHGRWTLCAFEN